MDRAHRGRYAQPVPPRHAAQRVGRVLRRALIATDTPPRPITYTPLLVGYVSLCVAGAAAALGLLLRPPTDWQSLLVGGFLVFLLSRTSVRQISGAEITFTATVLLQVGMVLTFGAAGALTGAIAEGLGVQLRARVGPFRLLFNMSNVTLASLAAWSVYTQCMRLDLAAPPRLILSGVVAGLVTWTVNHSFLAGVFCARSARVQPGLEYLRSALTQLPYFVLYGTAATAFPILHGAIGTAGILTLVGPLMGAQLFLLALERASTTYNAEKQAYVTLVEQQNKDLQAQRVEVVRAYDATLIALTNALDARDKETEGHSRRVVEYSRAIGKSLGLDGDKMRILSHGALLHDIGKIGVPDAILLKPAKLSEEEWELMRRHPAIGEAMVRDVDVLREARRVILHHHERWDGSGYPRGLRATEIDQGARIFAVADACDAITQDRPYRRSASMERARDEIRRGRGLEFDPDAVDAFLTLAEDELVAIQRLRTPPGLDLLIDSDARARYLASLGLGLDLIPA